MMIYVAGPYSGETEELVERNVSRAIGVGVTLMRMGHVAVIPHLTRLVDLWFDLNEEPRPGYRFYMDWDDALLRRCDALYLIASSPGADTEVARAGELGLPIYRRLTEVPQHG